MYKKCLLLLLAPGLLLLTGCPGSTTETKTPTAGLAADSTAYKASAVATRPGLNVQAEPLPDPGITGFKFPEDSTVINGWIQRGDAASIDRHGWGIWTALSARTRQVTHYDSLPNDTLRVYETWPTDAEVDAAIRPTALTANKATTTAATALLLNRPQPLHRLSVPRQFLHDPAFRRQQQALRKRLTQVHTMGNDSRQQIFVTVSYDPVAASTIVKGKLFWASTLQGMLDEKKADIPDMPASSIAIKPVYEVIPGGQLSKGLYQMKVWTNTTPKFEAFDQDKWSSCVYVDINNRGRGQGQVSKGCLPATPATTYNLHDFVHFTITEEEAKVLNGDAGVSIAHKGDYAVLVAMHITTKEIKRWTWQTMWWAPDPNHVPAPSNATVLAQRPAQLTGAPRHYAMSISYQMIDPVQPFVGGKSVGQSIYVFNPYLEANFGPEVFKNKKQFDEPSTVTNNKGLVVMNGVGVRSNCMSCHAQASFTPLAAVRAGQVLPLGYLGDTYVDMGAPKFKGRLKTDFLWSIANMATETGDSLK